MCRILRVLIATIAYGMGAAYCQTPQAGTTTITFQSSTYSDMPQLLAREAPTGAVTVKASLGFPEQARDRYPAVIVVHGRQRHHVRQGSTARLQRVPFPRPLFP
jgi:hypothetical protein